MSLSRWDAPTGAYTSAIPPGVSAFRSFIARRFGISRTEVVRDRSRCQRQRSEHCFAGETQVITAEGVVPIEKLSGSTAVLLTRPVNNGRARWLEAPIHSFGEQELIRITLRRGKEEKVIRATDGHRWFVQRTRGVVEVTTDLLQRGDRLADCFPPGNVDITFPSPVGIMHGLMYGDGDGNGNINLYGLKNVPLARYFPADQPRSDTGREGVLQIRGMPRTWRHDAPALSEQSNYLHGWLAGYFAADGTISPEGSCRLASADRWRLEAAELVALRLGIVTYPIRSFVKGKNAYGPGGTIFVLPISGRTLASNFFLMPHHRVRWEQTDRSRKRVMHWWVDSIASDETEEVFCAVVPETGAFALDGYILTGNCECGAVDFFPPGQSAAIGRAVFDWCVRNERAAGVQSVIFRRRVIGFGNPTERHYSGAHDHFDHVHVGLSRWARANLTMAMLEKMDGGGGGGTFMALSDAEQKELLEDVRYIKAVLNLDGREKPASPADVRGVFLREFFWTRDNARRILRRLRRANVGDPDEGEDE